MSRIDKIIKSINYNKLTYKYVKKYITQICVWNNIKIYVYNIGERMITYGNLGNIYLIGFLNGFLTDLVGP